MKIYLKKENISIIGPIENHKTLCETDKNLVLNELITFDERLFQCIRVSKDHCFLVEELISSEGDVVEDVSWTCPFCGFVDEEEWNIPTAVEEYECPACSAITSVETEYIPKYTVELIKPPVIKDVEGKDSRFLKSLYVIDEEQIKKELEAYNA